MLPELAIECFDLYAKLAQQHVDLSAPFLPYAPPNYLLQPKRILYVGKATRGEYDLNSFSNVQDKSSPERILERTRVAANVFDRGSGGQHSAFWKFAEVISNAVSPGTPELANLSWTNLCKLGVQSGNPDNLLEDQRDFAIRMLTAEIAALQPALVLFVTNTFADRIVRDTTYLKDADFEKSEKTNAPVENVWWSHATSQRGAVLWMRHPQGASRTLTAFAIEKARELTS